MNPQVLEYANKELDNLVNLLIQEKNINYPEEQMVAFKVELKNRIMSEINMTIYNHLPLEKREEFGNILETRNPQLIQDYCLHNIPNLNDLLVQSLEKFTQTYLAS